MKHPLLRTEYYDQAGDCIGVSEKHYPTQSEDLPILDPRGTVPIPARPGRRTEHDMKCVGLGLPEGSPLKYVGYLEFPESSTDHEGNRLDIIGGLKAKLDATSEENARNILLTAWPIGRITRLYLL